MVPRSKGILHRFQRPLRPEEPLDIDAAQAGVDAAAVDALIMAAAYGDTRSSAGCSTMARTRAHARPAGSCR